MIGAWSSFMVAIVLAVVALAVVFFIVLKTIPFVSKGIDSILLGIKKPICCTMLGCKPLNANIVCSAFCWGVCE